MSKTDEKKGETKTINAKEIQAEAAKQSRVIKMNDRMKLKVLKDNGHYKSGQLIEPHRIYGEKLVEQGLAEELKQK